MRSIFASCVQNKPDISAIGDDTAFGPCVLITCLCAGGSNSCITLVKSLKKLSFFLHHNEESSSSLQES